MRKGPSGDLFFGRWRIGIDCDSTLGDGTMRKIPIKQVDAFTTIPYTGNPAGVVTDGHGLTVGQMQAIARELNLSETAFILPPTKRGADLSIRWFTPTVEVPLCGHATIAGFHALAEEGKCGLTRNGVFHYKLETQSGLLPVEVEKNSAETNVRFGLQVPTFKRASQYKLDLMRILNIQSNEFEHHLSIVQTDYLFVPIRRLHTMFSMKPNFQAISNFMKTRNLGGICVFTTETIERTSSVHSRFFAPAIGIDEDPVTGSSNGPLGVYLLNFGVITPGDGNCRIIAEQGDVIARKGRVVVDLEVKEGNVSGVSIGGQAVTVLQGELVI